MSRLVNQYWPFKWCWHTLMSVEFPIQIRFSTEWFTKLNLMKHRYWFADFWKLQINRYYIQCCCYTSFLKVFHVQFTILRLIRDVLGIHRFHAPPLFVCRWLFSHSYLLFFLLFYRNFFHRFKRDVLLLFYYAPVFLLI